MTPAFVQPGSSGVALHGSSPHTAVTVVPRVSPTLTAHTPARGLDVVPGHSRAPTTPSPVLRPLSPASSVATSEHSLPDDPDRSRSPTVSEAPLEDGKPPSKMYLKMAAYIHKHFPESLGVPDEPPVRAPSEDIYPSTSVASAPSRFATINRIVSSIKQADTKLKDLLQDSKSIDRLLPRLNKLYKVSDALLRDKPSVINPAFLSIITKSLPTSRHVAVSLKEWVRVETQVLTLLHRLNHAMWGISGLLHFTKAQGLEPDAAGMLQQFVKSISMAHASIADTVCDLLAWLAAKRRAFYISHLPSTVQDHHKTRLKLGPVVSSEFLFPPDEVKQVASEHQSSASVRSAQAMVDLASGSTPSTSSARKRPRSPLGRGRGARGGKSQRTSSPAARSSSPGKSVGFSPSKGILRSPSKKKRGFRR